MFVIKKMWSQIQISLKENIVLEMNKLVELILMRSWLDFS